MATLGPNRYGKHKVRVLRKHVDGATQSVTEISADVRLEGAFDAAFLGSDNTALVATDTVRNTILALAHEHLGPDIEAFALRLARHFLDRHAQVSGVHLELRERRWDRLTVHGRPAPHSFLPSPLGEPFTRLAATRDNARALASGVRGLRVLNSTGSAFVNFDRTEFTTLPDAEDRILSTEMEAEWTFPAVEGDFPAANARIIAALLEVFATHFSPSVQRTLFEMGEAALAVAPEIGEITLRLPNKHYFPANLAPFGLDNPNLTFVPQDEPHGQIEATVRR